MEESLGKKLIAARKSASITIDDAVYLAKIPRDVVIALEAENFGFFSSPLYARSFLKQYSDYIGANVEPWLDDLVPISLIDGQSLESYIDISEPISTSKTNQKSRSTTKDSNGGAMAAVWMILITGGLIYGGIKVFEKIEDTIRQSEIAENNDPVESGNPDGSQDLETATPSGEESSNGETNPEKDTNQPPVASRSPDAPRRAIIVTED
ncbi:helix-turn-helix domain-containing protein [Luteolibacter sp. AS25]|uniref:helix-turn-helix domain-containing protein n=1 Tax=Luteolibacter sp. AS25 TaxID=3135776 RepID=UPI00398AEB49